MAISREAFEAEVIRRARNILTLRGHKRNVSLNLSSLRHSYKDGSEENVVSAAIKVADDTEYWM